MTIVFGVFDVLRGPRLFEFVWHLLASVSRLNKAEIEAASAVLGSNAIRYSSVRVAEGRFLTFVFKINGGRPFVTFHTINFPRTGTKTRSNLSVVVHELVHVLQFEKVGSVYIWQALRAQRTDGYDYGGYNQLVKDRDNGKHLRDYNREQQGKIAQDYYRGVVAQGLDGTEPVSKAYEPFIEELRKGDL